MKKFWNKAVSRSVTRVLTLMGIGTTSLLFMACYGSEKAEKMHLAGTVVWSFEKNA